MRKIRCQICAKCEKIKCSRWSTDHFFSLRHLRILSRKCSKNSHKTKMATMPDRNGSPWVINMGWSAISRPSLWYINYLPGLSASYLKKNLYFFHFLASIRCRLSWKSQKIKCSFWSTDQTFSLQKCSIMPPSCQKKSKDIGKMDHFTKIAVISHPDERPWVVNFRFQNIKLAFQRCTRSFTT